MKRIEQRIKEKEIKESKEAEDTLKKRKDKVEEHESKEKEEIRKEMREIKKVIEERERRNNLAIRDLKKENRSMKEVAEEFLEKKFGIGKKIKKSYVVGRREREAIIVEMDQWKTKEKVMKEKKKLGIRRIFIDSDVTVEERQIQRKLRERARKEKMEGKTVKVGYKKMEIQGKSFV